MDNGLTLNIDHFIIAYWIIYKILKCILCTNIVLGYIIIIAYFECANNIFKVIYVGSFYRVM